MKVKTIIEEDFTNYKLPCMVIGTISCNWKCCTEQHLPVTTCQNNSIYTEPTFEMDNEEIYRRFSSNPITSAIVIAGLEPFDQLPEIVEFIDYVRVNKKDDSDIVIYTGYKKEELIIKLLPLYRYNNIIIKYGRYIPNQKKHFDKILGVYLASDNQYAEKFS